jgi:hypothetical protein
VKTVWGVMYRQSGQGQVRVHANPLCHSAIRLKRTKRISQPVRFIRGVSYMADRDSPSQPSWDRLSGEVERSIAPSGGTGSSGRWSRWSLGLQEFAVRTAKSSRQGQALGAVKRWLYYSWWYYQCPRCHGYGISLRTPVEPGWCGVRQRYLSVP